ncbi:hypothetical protein K488DRAFT_69979 [Vararia minispora EC-137]|uniref:Uncharacterized protein n=1 Tax=Vararia minispora EC-137 TaxID=1314806 RepID=A0ACB8QP23_9AGAM|nr:hypothetical protein K488DRAFT_69979 [Vararia minispora EC-137]
MHNLEYNHVREVHSLRSELQRESLVNLCSEQLRPVKVSKSDPDICPATQLDRGMLSMPSAFAVLVAVHGVLHRTDMACRVGFEWAVTSSSVERAGRGTGDVPAKTPRTAASSWRADSECTNEVVHTISVSSVQHVNATCKRSIWKQGGAIPSNCGVGCLRDNEKQVSVCQRSRQLPSGFTATAMVDRVDPGQFLEFLWIKLKLKLVVLFPWSNYYRLDAGKAVMIFKISFSHLSGLCEYNLALRLVGPYDDDALDESDPWNRNGMSRTICRFRVEAQAKAVPVDATIGHAS